MQEEPPKNLGQAGRALWRSIVNDFEIENAAGLALLRSACESLDLLRKVEAVIEREGMTLPDRYGCQKPHPLLATARDARLAMMTALRRLNLEEPEAPKARRGHPPGGHGL